MIYGNNTNNATSTTTISLYSPARRISSKKIAKKKMNTKMMLPLMFLPLTYLVVLGKGSMPNMCKEIKILKKLLPTMLKNIQVHNVKEIGLSSYGKLCHMSMNCVNPSSEVVEHLSSTKMANGGRPPIRLLEKRSY